MNELDSLNVSDLKVMASELGVKGYSSMKKEELIQAIEQPSQDKNIEKKNPKIKTRLRKFDKFRSNKGK